MAKVSEPEYLHVVWRLQRNQPPLSARTEQVLAQSVAVEAARCGVRLLALGGADDHLHLALRLPAGRSRRQVVEQLKASTGAHALWQRRNALWILSRTQLPYALSYILCQREHHSRGDLWPFWELAGRK